MHLQFHRRWTKIPVQNTVLITDRAVTVMAKMCDFPRTLHLECSCWYRLAWSEKWPVETSGVIYDQISPTTLNRSKFKTTLSTAILPRWKSSSDLLVSYSRYGSKCHGNNNKNITNNNNNNSKITTKAITATRTKLWETCWSYDLVINHSTIQSLPRHLDICLRPFLFIFAALR